MQKIQCPACGGDTAPETPCPRCGQIATNGADLPAEVDGWTIERPSLDVLAWAEQTFDQAEFLAAVREVEQGGGHRFEDFIDDIEQLADGQ